MILFPQMALPGTNRRASKYSNLVGLFDRQISARSLLLDAPGRPSNREIRSTTESGSEAKNLVKKSDRDSVIDSSQSPIASQPCSSRGVSYL